MNYTLIKDEPILERFIDFLPDLKENEGYFLILIARKKWNISASIPSAVKLRREVVMKKDKIMSTIYQWEVEKGLYVHRDSIKGDIEIPAENLGVYIGYNPKDQKRATYEMIDKCLDAMKADRNNINLKSMAMDALQTSPGTKHFIDIDIDLKDGEDAVFIRDYIQGVLPNEDLTFVRTSGGFHCLIRMRKGMDSQWYNKLNAPGRGFETEMNIMRNDLMPIPGCRQGFYTPHFF